MVRERERIAEDSEKKAHWRRWGPYLSQREWGTVREDYSDDGDAWNYFTHDQAHIRAYRWGEDGIFGISDNHQRLCFSFAFWNEQDPILKERLFGLSNPQGNHGEDVKELYYFLDNTPSHSYMKALYKYPQQRFPYERLRDENKKRGLHDPEFELVDTGIFEGNRYFDLIVEYAKADPEDLFIKVTAINRGPEEKKLHILPTLWFRNDWEWKEKTNKPQIWEENGKWIAKHETLSPHYFYFAEKAPTLFTENVTNQEKCFGHSNSQPYVKDAFHEAIIHHKDGCVNPGNKGTKAALHYTVSLKAGEQRTLQFRLTGRGDLAEPFKDADQVFKERQRETEDFYAEIVPNNLSDDLRQVQRQAFAGMLWNKQYYHYVIDEWIKSDPKDPNKKRKVVRNKEWEHLYNEDILSVPDNWEYPCYFSWDSAFHTLALVLIDPDFAKRQLTLLTREWYMHPNGQVPASEWNFDDVNPPVLAWAAWRVYKIDKKRKGVGDRHFLESLFHKLLLNFTWWVNRKDVDGKNVFEGGFLGLDNIGALNRSEPLAPGWKLYQSDATSWMAMYSLNMLTIALELSIENPAYEDMASKFFEHFLYISDALNGVKDRNISLWNEESGFYCDLLKSPSQEFHHLQVRSLVGLIPIFAVITLSPEYLERFPGFRRRMDWFLENRKDLCSKVCGMTTLGVGQRRLFGVISKDRLKRVLEKLFDEKEFLSPYGIRSLSKHHEKQPYVLKMAGREYAIAYEPGESTSRMFGGNSNWRGPVWMPLNMLIIEALQKFNHYYGDTFKMEFPTGSGKWMTLGEIAGELSARLIRLFLRDEKGRRPFYRENAPFQEQILFHEYFHGDSGLGLGASHQTGWTGVIAKLIQQLGEGDYPI